MKITKTQLKRIIREEYSRLLKEGELADRKYEEAFLVARSEGDFENIILDYINGSLSDRSRPGRFIADIMGCYDGKASARIEETIQSLQL